MKSVSQGKIFLADQRGMRKTESLKRFCTFNFEAFLNPHKTAVEQLFLFNDDLLAAGKFTEIEIERDCFFVLLPVTGTVVYTDDVEQNVAVEVGQVRSAFVRKGTRLNLSNTYEEDTISYICYSIEADEPDKIPAKLFDFELGTKNQLIVLGDSSLPFKFSIGLFDGRQEAFYGLNKQAKVYAFVLSGAFEVEGRLLHEKDGLALWDVEEIALEALSNYALILTIELPQQSFNSEPVLL